MPEGVCSPSEKVSPLSDDDCEKLCEAILLVGINQLDEHRDDTLIEKLISHVDQLCTEHRLDVHQWTRLRNICSQLIKYWTKGDFDQIEQQDLVIQRHKDLAPNVDSSSIGPIFSILGSICACDNFLSETQPELLLNWLPELSAVEEQIRSSEDFSLQTYFLCFWRKLLTKHFGRDKLLQQKLIKPDTLRSLINNYSKSASYFVREETKRLNKAAFVPLFNLNEDLCSLQESPYSPLLYDLHVRIQVDTTDYDVDILSSLLSNEFHQQLIKSLIPQIHHSLISSLNSTQSTKTIKKILQCLAQCLRKEDDIRFLFTKLIRLRKGCDLITFSTFLVNQNVAHTAKWVLYSLYPLAKDENQKQRLKQQHCLNDYETETAQSLLNDRLIIHIFQCLRSQLQSTRFLENFEIIFDCLLPLIGNETSEKVLREFINLLDGICKMKLDLTVNNLDQLIKGLLDMAQQQSNVDQCSILKVFRQVCGQYSTLLTQAHLETLAQFIGDSLTNAFKHQNLELVDSHLELLDVLTAHKSIFLQQVDPDVFIRIVRLWQELIQSSDFYWLKVSTIPLLLRIDLHGDDVLLQALNLKRYQLANNLLQLLKNENPLIRKAVVTTFSQNASSIVQQLLDESHCLFESNYELMSQLFHSFSEIIVFDVDVDIEIKSLNTLMHLFEMTTSKLVAQNVDTVKLIVKMYLPLFHSLRIAFRNDSISLLLKENAVQKFDQLISILNEHNANVDLFEQLRPELKDEKIEFCYQVEIAARANEDETIACQQSVMDQLFDKGYFPIQEVLQELTENNSERQGEKIYKDIRHTVSYDEIVDFLFKQTDTKPTVNQFSSHILDDILAARVNRDVVMDCY